MAIRGNWEKKPASHSFELLYPGMDFQTAVGSGHLRSPLAGLERASSNGSSDGSYPGDERPALGSSFSALEVAKRFSNGFLNTS